MLPLQIKTTGLVMRLKYKYRVKKTIPIFVSSCSEIISDKEICEYIILNLKDEKMKK